MEVANPILISTIPQSTCESEVFNHPQYLNFDHRTVGITVAEHVPITSVIDTSLCAFKKLEYQPLASREYGARDLLKYSPSNIDVIPRKLSDPEGRIVNGNEAVPHSFPHAVAIYINGNSFCGGSIITKNVILTAAHCIDTAKSVEIIAGAHNINKNEATQQIRTSTTFVVHEKWNRTANFSDIALIRLNAPLKLNDVVKVIQIDEGDCLSTKLDHTQGTVVGWGRFGSGGGISPVLRYVTNQIMTYAECKLYFTLNKHINKLICLDGSGGKNTCTGDDGSALFVMRNGIRVEVGLAAFESEFGCDIGYPSAFTSVACFKDWIKSKL